MENYETKKKEDMSCQPNKLIPSNVMFRLSRFGISMFSFQSSLLRNISDIRGMFKSLINWKHVLFSFIDFLYKISFIEEEEEEDLEASNSQYLNYNSNIDIIHDASNNLFENTDVDENNLFNTGFINIDDSNCNLLQMNEANPFDDFTITNLFDDNIQH